MLKEIKHVKVKTFLSLLVCIWLCSQIAMYIWIDEYTFMKIPKHSIKHQKSCLSEFLDVFKKHAVALILFDIEILPVMFQSRPESWHSANHDCKTLCKFHPENKNVISFAIQAYQFNKHKESIKADLRIRGFAVHLTTARDPMLFQSEGRTQFIPTYLWLAKQDHVIHVAILYERHDSYVWIGPVTEKNWKNTVSVLSHELSGGWHSMEFIGARFPTYEQAFEKSQRFLSFRLDVDGHKVSVPYHMRDFIKEYRESRFIDCDHARARKFKLDFPITPIEPYKEFRQRVKDSLSMVKGVFDKLHIEFWLSGGTLLGWHRECDVIPHSKHIVLGVWANTVDKKAVQELINADVPMRYGLGYQNDSYQLNFMSKAEIAIQVFSFYVEGDTIWYGGTETRNGRKYKFSFEKFDLCWTEYLELKVRVPCQVNMYVETSIGRDWTIPKQEWTWNLDPPNVQTNGDWGDSLDWEVMIPLSNKEAAKPRGEEEEAEESEVDKMIADALDEPQSGKRRVAHQTGDARQSAEDRKVGTQDVKEKDESNDVDERIVRTENVLSESKEDAREKDGYNNVDKRIVQTENDITGRKQELNGEKVHQKVNSSIEQEDALDLMIADAAKDIKNQE